MTTLASDFEANLREQLLEDVERELVGGRDNLAHQFVQKAHENLRAYGDRHDYDVEPVIESMEVIDVQRTRNAVTVRIGWAHEAASYFEMGTSDHTVNGDPILSFVWGTDDAPQWVREQFEQARGSGGRFESGYRVFLSKVEVEGIPESRFVRDALEWVRREVQ